MNATDEARIRRSLVSISKWQHVESNDYKKGMANMADLMHVILFSHKGSIEYRQAIQQLSERSR